MSIIRYNSLLAPSTFSNLFDQVFNEGVQKNGTALKFVPDVDLLESDNGYAIHVALPGFEKDQIKVEAEQNTLKISGERHFSAEDKGVKYHSVETAYGAFSRSFKIPSDGLLSEVKAEFNKGILEISIPKDKKLSSKTVIEIK